MANRSYLYSLSNRPESYADRPETISGLSEWAYAIPFSYRALVSGNPELCASLVSDGFEDEPANKKTKIHAISGEFEIGLKHLKKFFEVLRPLADSVAPDLITQMDQTIAFLEAHRNRFLLLETIELDCMTAEGEKNLRACVENELGTCRQVGAAIDMLPENAVVAGKLLKKAVSEPCARPLDAFYGLRLDDDYDNARGGNTDYPLGLEWTDVLYFTLWNRAQFEEHR